MNMPFDNDQLNLIMNIKGTGIVKSGVSDTEMTPKNIPSRVHSPENHHSLFDLEPANLHSSLDHSVLTS